MRFAVVVVLAAGLAWFTYWQLERLGRRAWLAALARGIAWAALGLLIQDLTCATTAGRLARPLVLLDGSLSMTAAGGPWREALDSARALGEVHLFGDSRPASDSLPSYGRSDLAPALTAALASDRRVMVVTDGEITDLSELPEEALGRVSVWVFPRAAGADRAITRLSGPDQVTAGDSIRLVADVRSFGPAGDSVRVEARLDQRVLARRTVHLGANGAMVVPLAFGSRGLPESALLTVALVGAADAEPRDDAREWLVRVTPTPGIVVLASPSDWDGRFLFRTLREVAQLPLRGYVRLEAGRWRAMESLIPVTTDEVLQAARRADVLVIKGAVSEFGRSPRARGVWNWPSGESGETVIPGEWYAVASSGSPIAGAFLGLPVDSFPPLIQITPIEPAPGDWTGFTAQLARRGADRPVFTGEVRGGRRVVTTAADGLWRWAFRGGSSEQGYRSLVASTLTWLLGSADSNAARARPVRPVVANGRPIVFEWLGPGPAAPLGISLTTDQGSRRDTLRFDGSGRAELWLATGSHRYQLDGGGAGVVAVDEWSDEWIPRPPVLSTHEAPAASLGGVTSSRRWIWLFAIVIAALTVEWWTRRQLGLR